ncbi:hypothetical protein, partial [Streptomyces sp. NPDC001274]
RGWSGMWQFLSPGQMGGLDLSVAFRRPDGVGLSVPDPPGSAGKAGWDGRLPAEVVVSEWSVGGFGAL